MGTPRGAGGSSYDASCSVSLAAAREPESGEREADERENGGLGHAVEAQVIDAPDVTGVVRAAGVERDAGDRKPIRNKPKKRTPPVSPFLGMLSDWAAPSLNVTVMGPGKPCCVSVRKAPSALIPFVNENVTVPPVESLKLGTTRRWLVPPGVCCSQAV